MLNILCTQTFKTRFVCRHLRKLWLLCNRPSTLLTKQEKLRKKNNQQELSIIRTEKKIKYISMGKLAVYTDNKSRHNLRFYK